MTSAAVARPLTPPLSPEYRGEGAILRSCLLLLLAAFASSAGSSIAAEPWWETYTPVAMLDQGGTGLETIQPGAARGRSGTLGWYGFWFLDEQDPT